jgi:hypothetical protein
MIAFYRGIHIFDSSIIHIRIVVYIVIIREKMSCNRVYIIYRRARDLCVVVGISSSDCTFAVYITSIKKDIRNMNSIYFFIYRRVSRNMFVVDISGSNCTFVIYIISIREDVRGRVYFSVNRCVLGDRDIVQDVIRRRTRASWPAK